MGSGPLATSKKEMGLNDGSLFIIEGGVEQKVGIVGDPRPASDRFGLEYVLKVVVALPVSYRKADFQLADFAIILKSGDEILARKELTNEEWTAIAPSLDYVAEVRWTASPEDTGKKLSIGLEAGHPADGVAKAEEGTIAAFDRVILCEASNTCTEEWPKCFQQMLDDTVLVDVSGSIAGNPVAFTALFDKVVVHFGELLIRLQKEVKKEAPRFTKVRAELMIFSDESNGATTVWPKDGAAGGVYLTADSFADLLDVVASLRVPGALLLNRKTAIGNGVLTAMRTIATTRKEQADATLFQVTRALVVVSDGANSESNEKFAKHMKKVVALVEDQPLTCLFAMSGSAGSQTVQAIQGGSYSPAACLAPNSTDTIDAQVDGGIALAKHLLLTEGGPLLHRYHCRQDPFHCTCRGDKDEVEYKESMDQCAALQTAPPATTQPPTPKATTAPTTTEAPTCTDSVGWFDIGGEQYNCEWYEKGSRCAKYGTRFGREDVSANTACCTCGGGVITPKAPEPSYSCVESKKQMHFVGAEGIGDACECDDSHICSACIFGVGATHTCTVCKKAQYLLRGVCVSAEGCIIDGMVPQKGVAADGSRSSSEGGVCAAP
jgi:hypothetical protein